MILALLLVVGDMVQCLGQLAWSQGDRKSGVELLIVGVLLVLLALVLS